MTRPKSFDPDQALERAVDAFWQNGYEATSVRDLLDAMQLNRGSLYDTYGDKRQLFEAALTRYLQSVTGSRLTALEAEDAGLNEVRAYFDAFLDRARRGSNRYGCLMTNTCIELAPHDAMIAATARKNFSRLERGFTRALRGAQVRGELAADQDPRTLARFLVGTLQGLQVLSKAGLPIAYLEDVVKTALAGLSS